MAFRSDFVNAFFGQKTDLPDDAGLGMGVVFETKIFQKQTAIHITLFLALFLRDIDSQNLPAYFFHFLIAFPLFKHNASRVIR
jgi:hypothetical protein